MRTDYRNLNGVERSGHFLGGFTDKDGRNWGYTVGGFEVSPDFKTDVGFVRRTDERRMFSNLSYRWWPETWIIDWGPRVSYNRSYQFDGILAEEMATAGVNFSFAKSISVNASINREMERFGGVDFHKTRYSIGGPVNTSRRIGFGAFFNSGDDVFYDQKNPFLGRETGLDAFMSLRPISRLQSQLNMNTSRFTDFSGREVFDVKIVRALTTYQFTDRVLFRNITEYNSFDRTLGLNALFTYRVNSGTAFYFGYDDRYRQGDRIEGDLDGDGISERLFQTRDFKRTNKAVFLKLQYLFRY
jgi:hypothetical protein